MFYLANSLHTVFSSHHAISTYEMTSIDLKNFSPRRNFNSRRGQKQPRCFPPRSLRISLTTTNSCDIRVPPFTQRRRKNAFPGKWPTKLRVSPPKSSASLKSISDRLQRGNQRRRMIKQWVEWNEQWDDLYNGVYEFIMLMKFFSHSVVTNCRVMNLSREAFSDDNDNDNNDNE